MKTITQTYEIKAPVSKVWQAFVDPKIIAKWGGGPAKMDDKKGTKFTLWGGDIFGTNTKVESEKCLQQDWTSGDWIVPSKVDFCFSESNGKTTVKLEHSGIPDGEVEDVKQGWKDYYLDPIKDLLEQ